MPDKNPSTFKILDRPLADCPNYVSVSFQDAENQFNQDGVTIIDTEDTGRIQGQIIQGSFQVAGLNTFDRCQRPINTWLAENIRGNTRTAANGATIGDTGGTIKIQFETSFRAIHLSIGDIIMVSNVRYNMTNWLFRVTSLTPTMNGRRVQIQASYHNDGWYSNFYGQTNAPLYQRPQVGAGRVPLAWCPDFAGVATGDSMFAQSELNFQIQQNYTATSDGVNLSQVTATGYAPVAVAAVSPQPPTIQLIATNFSNAGGTIPGGKTYYVVVCSKNVTGTPYNPSFPSLQTAVVQVPAGTNTNRIQVAVSYWPPEAVGYVVFMGTDPQKLSFVTQADSVPSSITINAYNERNYGCPDVEFNHVRYYVYPEAHGGIMWVQVISCTSTTITLAVLSGNGAGLPNLTGYDVSLYALVKTAGTFVASQNPLPWWNAKIASNTANVITLGAGLDGNTPNPTTIPRGDGTNGLVQGDVLGIRSLPTVGSDGTGNYVEDLNWINNLNPLSNPIQVTGITNANPGVVTTAAAHGYSNGDRVYLSGGSGMTSIVPGVYTIAGVTATTFNIGVNTTSSGTFTPGTTAQSQKFGFYMDTNTEQGRFLWIISGTARGTFVAVMQNTRTRIYIQGAWPNGTPDATSRYVIVSQPAQAPTDGSATVTSTINTVTQCAIDVNNLQLQNVAVRAVVVGPDGSESLWYNSPMRDFFVIGRTAAANITFIFQTLSALAVTNSVQLLANYQPATYLVTVVTAETTSAVTIDLQSSPDNSTWTTFLTTPISIGVGVITIATQSNFSTNLIASGSYVRAQVTNTSGTAAKQVSIQLALLPST